MDRLDEIEARALAATEGPWSTHDFGHPGQDEPSTIVVHTGAFDWRDIYEHGESLVVFTAVWDYGEHLNATFIAHAREDVPWLIARVRELEARLTAAES